MVFEAIPVSPQSVTRGSVMSFLRDHNRYNSYFDPSNATTQDHASALRSVRTLYGTAMEDGGLSADDRGHLAALMTNTNAAAVDAYYQETQGFDPDFYNAGDLQEQDFAGAANEVMRDDRTELRDATDTTATAAADENFGAGDRTINRADDGRIIYDSAPAFDDIRTGDATLGLGHKSEGVRDVQQALLDGGFYDGQYTEGADAVDGFYGPKTTEAVRRWQEAQGIEQTGQLNGAQLDALLAGENVTGDGVDQVAEDRHADAVGLDVNFFEADGDVWAGVTDNFTIRNARDRAVADDATHIGIGAEGQLTIAEVEGNLGDSMDFGVDGRAAVDANAYLGAEAAGKWDEDGVAVAGRAGAYAGVDAEASWGIGLRYFGIGQRNSVGVGAGAEVEGHASMEDGRLSLGYFAKGGAGVTAGHGNDVWIDFGQMGRDLSAAASWVGGLFTGVDTSRE